VITKRENLVENCFKMKWVYSFDKFGFFVPRLGACKCRRRKGVLGFWILIFFFFSFAI
jgi:Golgi nucleoside diphosphatase